MTWPATIGIAVLTGIATLLLASYVASRAVDWYHIPGREGESAYFVAGMAILGLFAGAVIAVIVSRIAGGAHQAGFLLSLGLSLAGSLGLVGVIGVTARLLADISPTIDDVALVVAVEVRYPAVRTTSPASDTGEGRLTLHSIPAMSNTVRVSENGPYWTEDARYEDGHWIVPGAVQLFTERGRRMIEVNPASGEHFGFLVLIARRPSDATLDWSPWMPRARPGSPPLPDQMSIRFRIRKISDVIRVEKVGEFEVGTMPGFYYDTEVDGKRTIASSGSFAISYQGKPVVVGSGARIGAVATTPRGLIALSQPEDGNESCYSIVAGESGPKVDELGGCGPYTIDAIELTNDTATFHRARRLDRPRGIIDRRTFANPGYYLLGKGVLDTRTGELHRFSSDTTYLPVPSVPPLGISPDGRSLVRYGFDRGQNDHLVLSVTDVVADRSYLVPIDPKRMRFATLEDLDPAWLDHHFEWRRGADGHDALVERAHFVPIPYAGKLSDQGGERNWRIEKAGRGLREALVKLLEHDFKATRLPADSDSYEWPVSIDGKEVRVASSSDFGFVLISMAPASRDPALVTAIGERINRELATGKYDSLFAP